MNELMNFFVEVGTLPVTVHLKLAPAEREGRGMDPSACSSGKLVGLSSTAHSWIQSLAQCLQGSLRFPLRVELLQLSMDVLHVARRDGC